MGRSNQYLELVRPGIHGDRCDRHGCLAYLDIRLIRGGSMREAIIIGTILILAVILWKPHKKGGKK